jgi:hypothetical protein
MANADDLIKSYVAAGFKKIHLDCSMSCEGDPVPLTDAIVAERAARLAKIAEETCREQFGESDLVYVIGTEVPVPGGAHETLTELRSPHLMRHARRWKRIAMPLKSWVEPSGHASLAWWSSPASNSIIRTYRLSTAESRRAEQNG